MSRQDGGQSEVAPVQDNGPGLDTQHAHPARVYNYWLGGNDNFPLTGKQPSRRLPPIQESWRTCGLPTASNTHEVARPK